VTILSLYTAKKQFEENLALFGNSSSQPEKFNLYGGLLNLTRALSDIEDKLERLRIKLDDIEREVRRR
jgi:hypothetical protein